MSAARADHPSSRPINMTKVLIVSVEPPWPSQHGGRIRTARIAEALSRRMDVLVAFPNHGRMAADSPVPVKALPWAAPSALRTRASLRPHLGGHFLRPITDALISLA